MTPALIVVAGLLVLALGVVSRRPWGHWWDGGGVLAEQVATLIAPPVGLAVTCAGLGVWVGERSALTSVLGAVTIVSGLAALWAVLSLPVPDRVLVAGSQIRTDRRRRRERRRRRRRARGKGSA